MSDLTQSRLKELLHYSPESGVFTWKHRSIDNFDSLHEFRRWNTRYDGTVAGSIHSVQGYIAIDVLSVKYISHRLVWLYIYGVWPDGEIDHINHNRSDNRISNLRVVSLIENQRNQSIPRNNTSGVVGVSWYKHTEKWVAYISVNGKRVGLGYFTEKADAVACRHAANIKHGFHPNHGVTNAC